MHIGEGCHRRDLGLDLDPIISKLCGLRHMIEPF